MGISKQAVHQHLQRDAHYQEQFKDLVIRADKVRKEHPGCGVEKLYYLLKPSFVGRDRFIATMMSLGYRLKVKRNYMRTTRSFQGNFTNLIKGLQVQAPNTVWQSDITYFRVADRFFYGVFIIDVYTKKIVGYQVSDHMRATANLSALKMALKKNQAPQYHHSDKGVQYHSSIYLDLLKAHHCKISMGNIAQENAYAERVNGTIKNEYINHWKPENFQRLKKMVSKAVAQYNKRRNHESLGKLSPEEFEKKWFSGMLSPKPLLTIFDVNKKCVKTVNSI